MPHPCLPRKHLRLERLIPKRIEAPIDIENEIFDVHMLPALAFLGVVQQRDGWPGRYPICVWQILIACGDVIGSPEATLAGHAEILCAVAACAPPAERSPATGRGRGRSGEREATRQKGVRWLRMEGGGTTSRALAEVLGSRLWRRRSAAGSGGGARQQALAEGAATSRGGVQWGSRRGAVFLYRRFAWVAGSGGTLKFCRSNRPRCSVSESIEPT
jgi:hypothetical protein